MPNTYHKPQNNHTKIFIGDKRVFMFYVGGAAQRVYQVVEDEPGDNYDEAIALSAGKSRALAPQSNGNVNSSRKVAKLHGRSVESAVVAAVRTRSQDGKFLLFLCHIFSLLSAQRVTLLRNEANTILPDFVVAIIRKAAVYQN